MATKNEQFSTDLENVFISDESCFQRGGNRLQILSREHPNIRISKFPVKVMDCGARSRRMSPFCIVQGNVDSSNYCNILNGYLFEIDNARRHSSGGEGSERKMEMDPACKTALITGGDTGIGFAMASHLLKANAKHVVITGTNTCHGREAVHKLNSAFGKNKATFIGANVTCMVQFEETFKTAQERHKHIDIFVNSAGVLDGKHWEREVVTNLVGTIRGTLLAFRYIGREGSGRGGVVVNLCGMQALQPLYGAPTFSATQSGILGLSRSFGHPYHNQKSGVRVLQLVTGFTQTDFIKGMDRKGMTPQLSQELVQIVSKAKKQNAEACGQALVHVIRCGANGSVWVIEGSRLFELTIPNWDSYRKLAAQYI
ncbi:15-hydroxyprostaglandin dehydrogenase [nad(+)] [Holotrichia oblita]|uniref:15-hydroxyprostaglandin dehydrogenase [nad(+)] n=1 Tax=Holotrichia oblita TaxID=644536 RepID=A0ACB9TWV4_HOLOL|nr:15-hydroxyprostaglandin dehydrogenase [nad(+)] [Holotrichia oblita]